MKIIQSEGGPLVCLSRSQAHRWSGITGKRFVGTDAPYENDYDAVAYVTNRINNSPSEVAILIGNGAMALLIVMPMETAVIWNDGQDAYIAQLHYANSDWRFESLEKSDFEFVPFDGEIPFLSTGGTYILFDSAESSEYVRNNFIEFELGAGEYLLSASLHKPDQDTLIGLFRFIKS